MYLRYTRTSCTDKLLETFPGTRQYITVFRRGDKQRYIIKCRDFQATREVGDFLVTQVSCEFYIEPIANQGQCVLTRSWRKQNEIFSNYFTFIIGGTEGV